MPGCLGACLGAHTHFVFIEVVHAERLLNK